MRHIHDAYVLLLGPVRDFQRWRPLVRAFGLVMILALADQALSAFGHSLVAGLCAGAAAIAAIPCATAWHRFVIEGTEPRLAWGSRESTYLGAATLMAMAFSLVAMALPIAVAVALASRAGTPLGAAILTVVTLAALAPALWLAMPHLLALPAIAINRKFDVADAARRLAPRRIGVTGAYLAVLAGFALLMLQGPGRVTATALALAGWPLAVGLLSHTYAGLYPEPRQPITGARP